MALNDGYIQLGNLQLPENEIRGIGQYKKPTAYPPDWADQLMNREFKINGVTYKERNEDIHQCLIVYGDLDLGDCSDKYNELLCVSPDDAISITIGHSYKNHDLLITPDRGTVVYVNGHFFNGIVGLLSLGDGSWGVSFNNSHYETTQNWFVTWLKNVYETWLERVYRKAEYLGLIEYPPLHEPAFKHLIFDNLPKGKIIVEKSQD